MIVPSPFRAFATLGVGLLVASMGLGCRERKAVAFGDPMPTGPLVPLAKITKERAAYRGRAVASSGTVTFVCQEKGCWMEVEDEGVEANVRIHEHAFTFPKDAAGKKARFYGTVTFLYEGKPS